MGRHGSRRVSLVLVAALLFVLACVALVLLPSPRYVVVLVFVFPVAIIASEMGTRAGLLVAAASVATSLVWLAGSSDPDDPRQTLPRSVALFFLAWVIGRTSDRAARSRGLLEQVLASTADAVFIKDLQGRYLAVNAPAARLIGRPVDEIVGHDDAELGLESASEFARHEAEVLRSGAPSTYELTTREEDAARDISIVLSAFRDASGASVGTLGVARDVTERRRLESELRRLAERDPLTGLFNRRRFSQDLERHVAEVARHGARGALLVVDIDGFKRVNDALGHHAGDRLIVSVAGLLRARVRESDIVARLGGDEFAVLLPEGGAAEASVLAGDLVRAVREEASPPDYRDSCPVTASVGVAVFPDGCSGAEEILIAADLAMYAAKEAGRDGFVVSGGLTGRDEPDPGLSAAAAAPA